jgi:OOP family OmpA-OmpF porin
MKNTLHLLIVCFFFAVSEGISQVNLVPNPSFEEYNTCPEFGNQLIESVNLWKSPNTNSPDYFNSCVTVQNGHSIPQNVYGFQEARTGDAYAGIRSMAGADGNNIREYIQIELTEILIQNNTYKIDFFVSLADNSMYSCNDIGVFLSQNDVFQNNDLNMNYNPQVINNTIENKLNDKTDWIKISLNYLASGNERFITIGNFKSNDLSDTTHLNDGTTYNTSYHYIDDVSIILNAENSLNEVKYNKLKVFPNPVFDNLVIEVENILFDEIKFFNCVGTEMKINLKIEDLNNGNKMLNLNYLTKGVYFLKFIYGNEIITKKIIKS